MLNARLAIVAFTAACAAPNKHTPPVTSTTPLPRSERARNPHPPAPEKKAAAPQPVIRKEGASAGPLVIPPAVQQSPDEISLTCITRYNALNPESALSSASFFYKESTPLYLANEDNRPIKSAPFLKCVFSASNQGDPVPMYVGCAEEPGDADTLSFETMGEWSVWLNGKTLYRDIVTQQETEGWLEKRMFCHIEPMSAIPQYAKKKGL